MNEQDVIDFAREAIFTLFKLGAPIMATGLAIGLTIAIFQALTQIQEMTLTFVPKILVVFLALLVFMPWMIDTMTSFMDTVVDRVVNVE